MNVTSIPTGVKVYLDSAYVGDSPSVFPEIAPGVHSVEFSKDGFKSVSKNVTILEGRTTNVMVVLMDIPPTTPEDTSSSSLPALLVVIIGIIAIAIGGYYYWSEKRKGEKSGDEEPERESE